MVVDTSAGVLGRSHWDAGDQGYWRRLATCYSLIFFCQPLWAGVEVATMSLNFESGLSLSAVAGDLHQALESGLIQVVLEVLVVHLKVV